MLIDGRPIAVGNGIARNGFIEDRVPTLCGVRQYGKGIWGGSGGGSGRALGACSGGVLWGRATRALAVLQQVRPHAHWRPRPRASGAPRGTPGGPARRGAARAALSRRTAPRQLSLMSLMSLVSLMSLTTLSPMAAARRRQGLSKDDRAIEQQQAFSKAKQAGSSTQAAARRQQHAGSKDDHGRHDRWLLMAATARARLSLDAQLLATATAPRARKVSGLHS